jgi:hypothetical protein
VEVWEPEAIRMLNICKFPLRFVLAEIITHDNADAKTTRGNQRTY